MSKCTNSAHMRFAKPIDYALTVGTSQAWEGFNLILMTRLIEMERAASIRLDCDTAYASMIGNADRRGEVVQWGGFAKFPTCHETAGLRPVMLWAHA